MTGKFKYALAGCGLLMASSAALANKDLKEKDANNDGRVTRAEFITAAEEKFSKMDENNDGILAENEFREHHADKKAGKKDQQDRY
jgi:Ca2+-binding EF-hand superfamily protein